MDRRFVAGLVLALLGIVAYVVGVTTPYPGRALAVTLVMVGVTLIAVGDFGG